MDSAWNKMATYIGSRRGWLNILETVYELNALKDKSFVVGTERPSSGRRRPERLESGGPCWLLKLRWMGTQEPKWRGPSLVGSLGLSCRYRRFLFCPVCSSRPVQKFFSSRYTISIPLSPSLSKLAMVGSRAGLPVSKYLSLEKTTNKYKKTWLWFWRLWPGPRRPRRSIRTRNLYLSWKGLGRRSF